MKGGRFLTIWGYKNWRQENSYLNLQMSDALWQALFPSLFKLPQRFQMAIFGQQINFVGNFSEEMEIWCSLMCDGIQGNIFCSEIAVS